MHVALFDGVCDQTKKLQTLYNSMPNADRWIISSSGHNMFVRFATSLSAWSSIGFSANIHYGKQILNQT